MNDSCVTQQAENSDVGAGSPPSILLHEMSSMNHQPWRLTLHQTHATLSDSMMGRPAPIPREEFMTSVVFMESSRSLSVREPRKMIFRMDRTASAQLCDWIGSSALAIYYLNRRFGWAQLCAFLVAAGSLMSLMPATQEWSKLPFQPALFTAALVILAAGMVVRWKPHPALFLFDSSWFGFLAVRLVLKTMHGGNKFWLMPAALLAFVTVTGLRHFIRFRHAKMSASGKVG